MAALWAAISCAAIIPSSSSFGLMPIRSVAANCLSIVSLSECLTHSVAITWLARMLFQSSEEDPPIAFKPTRL